ncbi:hypothetical protein FN846DRAFT_889868 [Sphaerosporella brunnea]|uniref:UBZ3-type domain-containing protein n=1 Tax=Sphaerosporella brunnea TaxID=1250544 RepID=A0A5J5EYH1_9PEZI|nr:hypothetical protein FN846DRAFT_889868 [Sphaerosporella brunnea]
MSRFPVIYVKQLTISPAGKLDKEALLKLAEGLLKTVTADSGAWPCAGMSLQVGGIEDREEGNQGISAFLLKGEQAVQAAANQKRVSETPPPPVEEKRRKVYNGIGRFFAAKPPATDERLQSGDPPGVPATFYQESTFHCPDCDADIVGDEAEHKDWHFAKAIADEERAVARERVPPPAPPPGNKSNGGRNGKKKNGGGSKAKLEKGQRVLKF